MTGRGTCLGYAWAGQHVLGWAGLGWAGPAGLGRAGARIGRTIGRTCCDSRECIFPLYFSISHFKILNGLVRQNFFVVPDDFKEAEELKEEEEKAQNAANTAESDDDEDGDLAV